MLRGGAQCAALTDLSSRPKANTYIHTKTRTKTKTKTQTKKRQDRRRCAALRCTALHCADLPVVEAEGEEGEEHGRGGGELVAAAISVGGLHHQQALLVRVGFWGSVWVWLRVELGEMSFELIPPPFPPPYTHKHTHTHTLNPTHL
jgi:hypothetical protein